MVSNMLFAHKAYISWKASNPRKFVLINSAKDHFQCYTSAENFKVL